MSIAIGEQTRVRWYPETEEDRNLVTQQLEEILSTSQFTSSKRYPAFLQYVVETAVSGRDVEIKERSIGIDVFHRQADYDTNNDTVVRFTAGEVRKRLARFYHENPSVHPIHIVLPTGSYVPEFYKDPFQDVAGIAIPTPGAPSIVAAPTAKKGSFTWLFWALGSVLLCCAGCGIALALHARRAKAQPTAIEQFWSPFAGLSHDVLICPGTVTTAQNLLGANSLDKNEDYLFVSMETATTLIRVTKLLDAEHIGFVVRPAPTANLTDLRAQPLVLIGAYTNQWTLRLVKDLPFRFEALPNGLIYSVANPSMNWTPSTKQADNSSDDYAVVARYRDPLTENWTILIAGLGRNGTQAAADFVASPKYLGSFERTLPAGWNEKNLEVVLKTSVIGDKPSAPTVQAIRIW